MRRLRWPLRAAAALLWASAALLAVLIAWRVVGLPPTRGELVLEGPRAALELVRDPQGVAHVFADDPLDAYFGLGFAHGQDRLWQLEMHRRAAAGRLAEVLGAPALAADRMVRTLGVAHNARAVHERLDAATRAALQAYADGVNAAIARTRGAPWTLPPEFLLLGVRPEPWTPADSIGWATMMAWDLSGNGAAELLRFSLSARLDPARIAQLFDLDRPIPEDWPRRLAGVARPPVAALLDPLPSTMIDGAGSNNWVVDGSRSVRGKPLLANDPHLSLSTPSTWYLAHLQAPGLRVIGATLPGLPYVVLGRTDRIAWGLTNTGPDTQDLYVEQVDPARPDHYRTPTGWARFGTREETIRVKGADDVVLTVRSTRHGPVISDASEAAARALAARAPGGATHVLAMAWTALSPEDRSVAAGLRLNRARDREGFLEALRDFHGPQQNVVYADVDGRIGFVAPGRIPVRRPDNDLSGLVPAPGWDARYDWTGWIPFEQLPQRFDARDGAIVTANQRIVDGDPARFLSAEWTLPHRHDRIVELLARERRHDPAGFARIQADTVSLAMRELLPPMLGVRSDQPLARFALGLLAGWDGDMALDRSEPLIATAWIDRLRHEVFADEVGEVDWPMFERHRARTRVLTRVLTEPTHAAWCDRIDTPAVETCSDALRVSLEASLDALVQRYGRDPARWRWGDAHVAIAEHRPFGRQPLLARVFDLRVAVPGDAHTVNAGRPDPWRADEPFASRFGAGYRAIYDLGDPERSMFVQSTGQSGHRLSPRYADLLERWARVEHLPMRMDRAAIDAVSAELLRIRPAPPR
jgi:penicillin amidase